MEKNSERLVRGLTVTAAMSHNDDGRPAGVNGLPQASIPLFPNPRLAVLTAPGSVGAEKFRVLAVRLRYLQEQHGLKKLVITSTMKGEGKSVISANLALTCARRQATLLIDGDLRQSGLAELFGSHSLPGLGEWWTRKADISSFLRRLGSTSLWYLPAGENSAPPLEILQSERLALMLAQVAEWFSWIIIDSPPLAPVADPRVWASHTDGALLVVREGTTPRRLLYKSLEEASDLKLLGIVMNASRDTGHRYYARYYRTVPQVAPSKPSYCRQVGPTAEVMLPDGTED